MKPNHSVKHFNDVAHDLPRRSQEIIKLRFGIDSAHPRTLEHIGKKHGITRERVRQIIKHATGKIGRRLEDPVFAPLTADILLAIGSRDGIIKESEIIQQLGADNPHRQRFLLFLGESLNSVSIIKGDQEIERSWTRKDFSRERWQRAIAAAKNTLETQKEVLSDKQLADRVIRTVGEFGEREILNFVEVSAEINRNPFGKWGLIHWVEVRPKGMREKAFVVLKESKEPLHFREIADRIDKYQLGKRKAHPQTVHNELIKDNRFVLVGRGIYALSQWGYQAGTVRDVIRKIIEKSARPLSREEIVAEVLKLRRVRETTVLVNLNSGHFQKVNHLYMLKK